MTRLLLALTLADLASFAVLARVAGEAGEVNGLVLALWHLSPLALLAVKVGPAVILGWIGAQPERWAVWIARGGAAALAFGVGCNAASLIVVAQG